MYQSHSWLMKRCEERRLMKMKSPLACRRTAVGVHILCLSFSLGNGESCRASVLMVVVVVFRVAVFMVVLMADHQVCDRKWRFLSKPVSGLPLQSDHVSSRGAAPALDSSSSCPLCCNQIGSTHGDVNTERLRSARPPSDQYKPQKGSKSGRQTLS